LGTHVILSPGAWKMAPLIARLDRIIHPPRQILLNEEAPDLMWKVVPEGKRMILAVLNDGSRWCTHDVRASSGRREWIALLGAFRRYPQSLQLYRDDERHAIALGTKYKKLIRRSQPLARTPRPKMYPARKPKRSTALL